MNPVLIYQNEAKFDFNNKFTIEFSDNNVDLFVNFSTDRQYYIASLNCNIIKKNKTKTTFESSEENVKKLSIISRNLLSKGAAVHNDIDYVKAELLKRYNLPNIAPHTYKLVQDSTTINNNCFSYQFYDVEDKRLKFAKIYSPFTHFKKGLIFKGEKNPNKENQITIQLINNEIIKFSFYKKIDDRAAIESNLYRDYNARIWKDPATSKIYINNPAMYLWAEAEFARKGTVDIQHVFDTILYRNIIVDRNTYPFYDNTYTRNSAMVMNGKRLQILQRKEFFTFGTESASKLQDENTVMGLCIFKGFYNITSRDLKEIKKLLPNFSFRVLSKWRGRGITILRNNDIFYPTAKIVHPTDKTIFDPKEGFMTLSSQGKYKDYLSCNEGIFFKDVIKNLPHGIDKCEKLFDEKVLEVKKLVESIGQPKHIPQFEQINVALYDESNMIEETYVQRINKKIQLYGIASIPFAETKKNHIVSLKNLLPFRINENNKKHKITFSLENLEGKTPIKTSDNKIYNLSIIAVEDKKMPKIQKEITIEALQSFDKYQRLNPIEIQITDSDIFKELTLFNNTKIKYRFVPNSILISSSVQEETEVIFLAVTGLNEARDILLNGQKIKSIGCIYTNEIEGWDQIKKITSNWISCKLSNSRYPLGAKHLGFEFVTSRLNALIDFTLYLLDQNGKEITFASTEEKTPALNFSIQIIS